MSNEARNHKDNVFCLLYKDKKNLLSLYNAMNNTSYEKEKELEVVTLEGAICLKMKNDAAFVIDSTLNLYEQQASVNPNMALRNLYYVTEELKKIVPPGKLYRTSKVKIPTPRFIVFYNGAAKQPEKQVYKLSEVYLKEERDPELELKVTVININQGYSKELLKKCESLRGYMMFVEKVRNKKAAEIRVEEAVRQAVNECISEGILSEFFREHREEIVDTGIFEFNQELYDQALLEDGEAIGRERGREESTLNAIKNMVDALKMTVQQAMIVLKVPKEEQENYRERLEKTSGDKKEETTKTGIYEFDQEVHDEVLKEDAREATTLRAIENIMDTLNLTMQQAMAALKVPEDEWEMYAKRIKQ
ncbi:MAG: hypothetical protein HDR27_01550 [Lachnospiraceae bacterium]|nr:hypothetical protein [Lachnospiraceae bacterium]